ncbi:MAG: hypothetical protein ACK4YQ_04405 [Phenylobacterium sp.]|uniref:hypothetical protein n=1 Tax=Phenylobacterium sp. TaxID=1871053 RepID=UPI00391D8758
MTSIASYLFSQPTAADQPRAGSPRTAPQQIVDVNGVSVDLSGTGLRTVSRQKVELGQGVAAAPPPAAPLSPQTLAAAVELQAAPGFSQEDVQRVRAASIAGTPYDGIGFASEVEIVHQEAGALQSAPGLGFIPGNVFLGGDLAGYVGEQIDAAGELADAERTLQAQYGSDVKLAYDSVGGGYVMLRPGQAGYDDVRSAQQVFQNMKYDLWNMDMSPKAYADVFARHGVTV